MYARIRQIPRYRPVFLAAMALWLGPWGAVAFGAITVSLEEGVSVHLAPSPTGQGLELSLACSVPADLQPAAFFGPMLAKPGEAAGYGDARTVAIPFDRLSPTYKRRAMEALFPSDTVDNGGWRHTVVYGDADLRETLWSLSAWLTGNGLNWHVVREVNQLKSPTLAKGDAILIPTRILSEEMRADFVAPAPAIAPSPAPAAGNAETMAQQIEEALDQSMPLIPADEILGELEPYTGNAEDIEVAAYTGGELTFGKDDDGDFALYQLKEGEAIYSDVVIRFTDFTGHLEVMSAARQIISQSAIDDERSLRPGAQIRIPMDMLSDRYKPMTTLARQQYEQSLQETVRLRDEMRNTAGTQDLEGVVIILDSGHGSKDTGSEAPKVGLYEDELAYDIVCRIKQLLETQTRARVYLTLYDPSEGCTPRNITKFSHDEDEVLLTTPNFPPVPMSGSMKSKALLNLRYYLANSIYDREVAAGVDPRNILFTSVHVDALHANVRGAMIYIPGAVYRADNPDTSHKSEPYNQIEEVKAYASTAAERQRDEALSRAFAETLYDELGKHRVRRHLTGPAIRNVIVRSRNSKYVPAVIRWNKVPTKILFETANIANSTDQERLADPAWRQAVANAYVDALRVHYGST